MLKEITYPFRPKTNKNLIPGQFWGVPLKNGRFACGRVLQIPKKGSGLGERILFLAGLMDWIGDEPPTFDSIAGHRILDQGDAHIVQILKNGEMVLGYRPLELDNLAAPYEQRGCWGSRFITCLAEMYFERGVLKE